MKEPKDKRTKEYKKWKAHQQKLQDAIDNNEAFLDKGLGDKVEEFTEKTGIKKIVKKVFGDDCGCDERKAKLNKSKVRFRFPVVRCFTEQQFEDWGKVRNKQTFTRQDQVDYIIPIYSQLFARKLTVASCCLDQHIKEIDKVYENYK